MPFWRVNNEAHGTHGVDFTRVCRKLSTRVSKWYTNQLPAFAGVSCNNTHLTPRGVRGGGHILFCNVICTRSIDSGWFNKDYGYFLLMPC